MRTGTDVLPLPSPNKAPKEPLNDLAPIWIILEDGGEDILITAGDTGRPPLNNAETKALMSAGLQSNLISLESLKPQNESNISALALSAGGALAVTLTGVFSRGTGTAWTPGPR